MHYMTIDEIRALSRRVDAIVCATDEELLFWMDEAAEVINAYCNQDFVFERQVTKRVRATTNTLVILPKVLSGDVSVSGPSGGSAPWIFISDEAPTGGGGGGNGPFEVFPGTHQLGYYSGNSTYRSPNAHYLMVTGDWGFVASEEELLTMGANALKAAYEAHRLSTVAHVVADSVNNVVMADALDFGSAAVLLNELKGVINSHMGDFSVHQVADVISAGAEDVTDVASAFSLLKSLKGAFNTHLANGGGPTAVHPHIDSANIVSVSTDRAGSVMPRPIRRTFLRLVQRIAIRDDDEDHRQVNSPYSSETLGDGYSYDLSNGTLRNLIRPEEAMLLLPYVNRGRVVI